jgi:hypothetical protein
MMGKAVDPNKAKKAAEFVARLRTWGATIAIVVIAGAGWVVLFTQKPPSTPPQGQQAAQGEKAPVVMGPDGKPKPESSGSYVLPYTLVLMCIALGLLLVTRPSNRRDRAHPEQYQERMDTMEEEAEPAKK